MTSMVISFILLMVIQVFFYYYIFDDLLPGTAYSIGAGIAIGIMLQGARFAFGIASINDFLNKESFKGFFGLLMSLGLTIFSTYEALEIAAIWGNSKHEYAIMLILMATVWLGWALEIRLCINITSQNWTAQKGQNKANNVQNSMQNGQNVQANPISNAAPNGVLAGNLNGRS